MTARGLRGWLERYFAAGLILALGAGASLAVSRFTRNWEREDFKAGFDAMAKERTWQIQREILSDLEELGPLRDFYASGGEMDRRRFDFLSAGVLARYPTLRNIRWIPRVSGEERPATEEPWNGALKAAGESRSRKVAVLDFAPEDGGKRNPTIVLIEPVYAGAPEKIGPPAEDDLRGYLAAFFDLGQLVESVLARFSPVDAEFRVLDITDPKKARPLYARRNDSGARPGPVRAAKDVRVLKRDQEFLVGGRRWLISCVYTVESFPNRRGLDSRHLFGFGLILTLLAAAHVVAIVRRSSAVENLVAERTIQLRSMNDTLENEIYAHRSHEKLRAEQSALLEETNRQLGRRERIMQSLLEDLQGSKEELEEQKKTLITANERLQEMSAMKDEFVATVSHELRTPITVIKEGVSLLLDRIIGPLNDEQNNFLAIVNGNIDRLTELVNNMLDLSKIEAGRMMLARRAVDLSETIRDAVDHYRPMAGTRTLNLSLSETGRVFADPDRVIQVLTNLLSNAVKFTRDDGTVTIVSGGKEGAVTVSVRDDGVGISKEDLPKLFQKFSQVGSGRRPAGTGLGLVVSKKIIEMHGGTIAAESERGKGACFKFTLPLYAPDFAFQEYFKDETDIARRNGQNKVGVIVFDASPFLTATDPARRDARTGEIVEFIRQRVHSQDAVLVIDGRWVAVIAATDRRGADSMIERLGAALGDPAALSNGSRGKPLFRSFVYPDDGLDPREFLKKAAGGTVPRGGKGGSAGGR